MPKYIVRHTVHYTLNLDANSEEEALRIASTLTESEFDVADEDQMTAELDDSDE